MQLREFFTHTQDGFEQYKSYDPEQDISILDKDDKALFNEEEFGELEQEEIHEILSIYSSNTEKFQAHSLKRIPLADFFTNIFYICEDNIFNFYGKPVINLTFYQIEVYSFGCYFKSIIQNKSNCLELFGDLISRQMETVRFT